MSRRPVPRLMIITDPETPGGVLEAVRAALGGAGGPRVAVQLRDKSAPARRLVELGRALRETTSEADATLLVNGRADVARAVRADGVHLPEGGLPPHEARAVLGEGALVGASCHDAAGLARAAEEGADYATLAPLSAVPGKGPALGLDRFAALLADARLPVLALGGIDAETVPSALAAGASGVAVIRAVLHRADPAAAACDLLRVLDTARANAE